MYEISNFCSLFPAQHFLKLSFWNDFFEDVFLIHLWLCGSSLLLVGSLQLQRAGAALWCGSGFSLQGLPLLWSSGSVVGAQAQLPRGMLDLPGAGTKPMCLALVGPLTTGPPGKSWNIF